MKIYRLTVQAGSSSIESLAWAAMLLRMYKRWLTSQGCTYQNLHATDFEYDNTYGISIADADGETTVRLRGEVGVHRLVRVSPFDAENRRHTSFAVVSIEGAAQKEDMQLRSYVLEPYTMVKDHATGVERADVQFILDGNIDVFLEARRDNCS